MNEMLNGVIDDIDTLFGDCCGVKEVCDVYAELLFEIKIQKNYVIDILLDEEETKNEI